MITGFGDENLSNTAPDIQLQRNVAGYAIATIPVVLDRAGSVVGISVACTEDRTLGSATFSVFLNGASTGFGVTLDATHTNFRSATQATGLDTFGANDRLDVRVTTVSWNPTTSDCEASVTVEF